jgi:hypothetical protein
MTDANKAPHKAESLDEQLKRNRGTITGDSDDPSLTEHEVGDMLRLASNDRKLRSN